MAQWFFQRQGETQQGPLDDKQLKAAADAGRFGPNDRVRRDGMENWVPAAKVRGLFPGETNRPDVPEVDHGTGPVNLMPLKKKPATPTNTAQQPSKPTSTRPTQPQTPQAAAKPVVKSTPATQQPARPQQPQQPVANPFGLPPLAAPDIFGVQQNPYGAQPDPFGTQPPPFGAQPDPFGMQPPPFGAQPDPFGGGGNDLASLALAAQSAPTTVRAAPLQFDTGPTRDPGGGDGGDGVSAVLQLAIPFAVALPSIMLVGAINAFIPLCLCVLSFLMLGGIAKLLGALAGAQLLKRGMRDANFALIYGGAVGVFSFYFLWATIFFVQANTMSAVMNVAISQVGEGQIQLEPQADGDPDGIADEDGYIDEEGGASEQTVEPLYGSEEQQKIDTFHSSVANLRQMGGDALIDGVSVFEAVWPFSLLKYFTYRIRDGSFLLYLAWLVEAGTLIGTAALATQYKVLGLKYRK